jgi:hypothetical protein
MNQRYLNFALALSLFAGWVVGLGAMAWLSADRPQTRPPVPASR